MALKHFCKCFANVLGYFTCNHGVTNSHRSHGQVVSGSRGLLFISRDSFGIFSATANKQINFQLYITLFAVQPSSATPLIYTRGVNKNRTILEELLLSRAVISAVKINNLTTDGNVYDVLI